MWPFIIAFFSFYFIGKTLVIADEALDHKKIFNTSFSLAFWVCFKGWLKQMCCPCFFISKNNRSWWEEGDHYTKQYITCKRCGYFIRVYK